VAWLGLAWSHTRACDVASALGVGTRGVYGTSLQYCPVSGDWRITGWPGGMAAVLLVSGAVIMYCSDRLVPLPTMHATGTVGAATEQ
jgi:hypothetical protein